MKYISSMLAASVLWAAILSAPATVSAEGSASLDFAEAFEGAVALYVGSPNAVVDLADTIVDPANFAVAPFVANGRTLVPLRFVSESLGAQVDWNGAAGTATVRLGDRQATIAQGSGRMTANGRAQALDVAPVNRHNRLFVPLRAVGEALGKFVFYDSGVVVVSDRSFLHPDRNRDAIEYLIFTLEPFRKDPYTGKPLSTEQLATYEQSVAMLESFDAQGESLGYGSAFAVGYGLFLTNYHVVAESSSYRIVTAQDRYYDVEGVVAADEGADLALVKTAIRTNVPPLRAAASTTGLAKGQAVVAIGNPEGLQNTISTGIVSGVRDFDGNRLIQTSAPITHGSSGGPLLNARGETIGVNAMGVGEADLNFAVPIDYARAWIAKYRGMPFDSVPVLDQDEFREPAEEDEADGPGPEEPTKPIPSDASASPTVPRAPTVPAIPGTTANGNIHEMSFLFEKATAHPTSPVVYMIDEGTSSIVAYDFEAKRVKGVSDHFRKPPRKLIFAAGELYAIFSDAEYSPYRFDGFQGGHVVVLDADTLDVADEWRTRIDPFDAVVDSKGHVYVASGSGQWTSIVSYDRATGAELSERSIRNASSIALHPHEDRIYAVDSDVSPRDLESFFVENGTFTDSYGSPYHGEYNLATTIAVTPDGRYVLNGLGGVFAATSNRTSNMKYVSSGVDVFDAFAYAPGSPEQFFTGKGRTITVYDTATLKKKGTISTEGDIAALTASGEKLIAATKRTTPGAALPIYALEVIDVAAGN